MALLGSQVSAWRKDVDGRGPMTVAALDAAPAPDPDGALVRETEKLLTLSFLLGRDHVSSPLSLADLDPEVPAIPFDEAVSFLKARAPLTKAEWSALEPELRFRAFTVAALSTHDNVAKVREMAIGAVEKGTPLGEFWTEANSLKAAGLGESPWYWETVYRTNTQTAYNAGRAAVFTRAQPEYLEFVGIEDGRQTEICAARSGTILPAAHPFWKTNWPPLHFNCRSTVRAVFQEEADLMREANPNWDPSDEDTLPHGPVSKGFGGNPISSGSFYKFTPSMIDRAKQYGLLEGIERFAKELGLDVYLERDGAIPAVPPASVVPIVPEAALQPKLRKVPKFGSIREAEAWIVDQHLADACSFKKIDLRIVQEWSEALAKDLETFPEARKNMQFFGSIQEQNKLIRAKIIERIEQQYKGLGYGEETAKKLAGDYATKWMRSHGYTPSSGVLAQVVPFEGYRGIAINNHMGSDYEKMQGIIAAQIKKGHFPEGGGGVAAIYRHEFGHVLDVVAGIRTNAAVESYWRTLSRDQIREGLSGYATTSMAEFIAEAWSEYSSSPSPRPIAVKVGKLIVELMKEEGKK